MNILIIGNGIAGNTASLAIRKFNKSANVTIISEEIHPEYSTCVLPQYIAGELDRQSVYLKTLESYRSENIDCLLNQKVRGIDVGNKRVFVGSRSMPYDKLILATGAKPIIPKVEGLDNKGVFFLKSLADADEIASWSGKAAVVVGCGPIGIEVGIALRKKGYEVTLIESLDRILPRVFNKKPASILQKIVEEHQIRILIGERVTKISGNGKVTGLATDKREMECDTIILAIGMTPNVDLAQNAGLRLGKLGGIWVNKHMVTSVEDIYACGDCAQTIDLITKRPSLSLLWHNAKEQGMIGGYNCIGIRRQYPGVQAITGLDVFGIHASSIGNTSAASEYSNIQVIEGARGGCYCCLIFGDNTLVGAQSISKASDIGILLGMIKRGETIDKIDSILNGKGLQVAQLAAAFRSYAIKTGLVDTFKKGGSRDNSRRAVSNHLTR